MPGNSTIQRRYREVERAVQALLFAFHETARNLSEIDSLCAGPDKAGKRPVVAPRPCTPCPTP